MRFGGAPISLPQPGLACFQARAWEGAALRLVKANYVLALLDLLAGELR